MTNSNALPMRTVSLDLKRQRRWRNAGARAMVTLALLAGSAPLADADAMASKADHTAVGFRNLVKRNHLAEHTKVSTADKSVEVLKGVTRIGSQVFYSNNAKFDTKGQIAAEIHTYDYRILYKVYNMSLKDKREVWISEYLKDAEKAKVERVAVGALKIPVKAKIRFRIAGEGSGSTLVYFGYETIRIKLQGKIKDFVIVNPASAVALAADGTKYRGTFEAG